MNEVSPSGKRERCTLEREKPKATKELVSRKGPTSIAKVLNYGVSEDIL